jgi:hypothetical protein
MEDVVAFRCPGDGLQSIFSRPAIVFSQPILWREVRLISANVLLVKKISTLKFFSRLFGLLFNNFAVDRKEDSYALALDYFFGAGN